MIAPIALLGAGRMGRGLAVTFAYAGHPVALLDARPRDPADYATLAAAIAAELRATFATLATLGLGTPADAPALLARITVHPASEAPAALAAADYVFEGVPELLAPKRAALAAASRAMRPDAVLASTTSTILVDVLADAVEHPARFLNAHWLNPAYLMPLVELMPGAATAPATTARLKTLLHAIGKIPVTCAAVPGFIVPRLQVLAMNEAARMVEEGVASASDVDLAVRHGFGFRFGVLGLLEFIDWGGGDILHHASAYLTGALASDRYAAPPIVGRNMAAGRRGIGTGGGFLDYAGLDLEAWRATRLAALASRLREQGLARPPVLDTPGTEPAS